MQVQFGTTTCKQGVLTEVKAADHSEEDLRVLAAEAGVDASGTKEQLAARLSAKVTYEPLSEPRVVYVNLPEGTSLSEAFTTLTAANGVVANWADDVAWVETDSPGLAALLCEHYGCAQGAPGDLEDTHYTANGPPGVGPVVADHVAPVKDGESN